MKSEVVEEDLVVRQEADSRVLDVVEFIKDLG